MNTQYISLAQLLQDAQVYEYMPVPMQAALRRSVWLTLATGFVTLLVFVLIPPNLLHVRVASGGFFLGPSAEIANFLLDLATKLFPYLAVLNVFNLFLTLVVLTLSMWMLRPVREPVHWVAAANAVPAVVSIGIALVMGGLLALIMVVLVVIWIVIIVLGVLVIIGLGIAFRSR